MNAPPAKLPGRATALLMTGVIGIAIVGFIVGINHGVQPEDDTESVSHSLHHPDTESVVRSQSTEVMRAADYSEMRQSEVRSAHGPVASLPRLHAGAEFERCITCHNPHTAAVRPNEADKLHSLAVRSERRAFNGAPPVIPHAVDRTNDAACYVCHGEGAMVDGRVANRMSHGRLANCVQCHAAGPPPALADFEVPASNSFVGLPAPVSGPRAFAGAPPEIPHSTWMREQCLSCHGPMGWPGLEVTHRWRTNCQQCHATSAVLEQAITWHETPPLPTLAGR